MYMYVEFFKRMYICILTEIIYSKCGYMYSQRNTQDKIQII